MKPSKRKHAGPPADLTGMRFGQWLVLKYAGKRVHYSAGQKLSRHMWFCRCDCGVQKQVDHYNLTKGLSTKCTSRHGVGTKKLRVAWQSMKRTEQLPEEWRDFDVFRQAVGDPPDSKARLVRCDLTKPHSLENILWVSPSLLRQVRKKAREEHVVHNAMLMEIHNAKSRDQMIRCMVVARRAGYTYEMLGIAAGMTTQRVHRILTAYRVE